MLVVREVWGRAVQVLVRALAQGITDLWAQIDEEPEAVAPEIDVCHEGQLQVVDRALVAVLWLLLEGLFPAELGEIELGLEAQVLFRDPSDRGASGVTHFHAVLYLGHETDVREGSTKGAADR